MGPLTPHPLPLTFKPHFIPAEGYVVNAHDFPFSIMKSDYTKIHICLIPENIYTHPKKNNTGNFKGEDLSKAKK